MNKIYFRKTKLMICKKFGHKFNPKRWICFNNVNYYSLCKRCKQIYQLNKEAVMAEQNTGINGINIDDILKNSEEAAKRGVSEGEKPELTVGDDLNTDKIRGKTESVTREEAEAEAPIDDPENKNLLEDQPKPAGFDPAVGPEVTAEELSKKISQREVDFGVINEGHLAIICHEANKVLCEMLGDNSQVNWAGAPAWQKESAVQGVKSQLEGNLSPMDQHAAWMRTKHEDGWKYGLVKDAEAKTHPCLVPYAELPPEQQIKDFLFTGIIQTLRLFLKGS